MGNSIIARAERKAYLALKRRKLKNKTPTIIASNCNGGFILHDLGLKFNTPTVNLYFDAADFLKFLSDMDGYFSRDLVEEESALGFPVGRLGDIRIYFMHYDTFEEAARKWRERSARIDRGNLFVIMTDKNGCTYDDIKRFNALPYTHKVIFTHKPYSEFKSATYIRGFESDGEVGVLSDWKPGFLKRRYIDDFDYVSFLNGKMD